MKSMLYLDHAATTPMRPGVWDAMEPYATSFFGNPSGTHGVSRRAKNALEDARERVAAVIGAEPLEIVFTGGGTESDNLAIKGAAQIGGGSIITSPTEHEAVLETADFLERHGHQVHRVTVDSLGRVEPAEVARLVGEKSAVVSIMTANNETGVIQPVAKISQSIREADTDIVIHTDAVHYFVSEPTNVDELGVDLLTLSAHKFGGPRGVGMLYVRSGTALEPVLHGGGQELGRRSGTQNVAGAIGMALAMEMAESDRGRFREVIEGARGDFEAVLGASVPGLQVNAPQAGRLIQHSHVWLPGVRNETLLIRMDQLGLAASAGSACQSGAATVSHVLRAMGFEKDQARQCLRFSFGWTNQRSDGEKAASVVLQAMEGLA